jgi:circadian clock protein KaiB
MPVPDEVRLRLYVAGIDSARARHAIAAARDLAGRCAAAGLDVVDVILDPEIAEAEDVRVSPTLDRVAPAPRERVVGDITDLPEVARELGLTLR